MNIKRTFNLENLVKEVDQTKFFKREKYIEFTDCYFRRILIEENFNFNELKEKNCILFNTSTNANFYHDAKINDTISMEINVAKVKDGEFIVNSKITKNEVLLSEITMNYMIKTDLD